MWVLHAAQNVDVLVYNFLNQFAGSWFLDHIAAESEMNGLLRGGVFFAAYWYFWFQNGIEAKKRRRMIVVILVGTLLALVANRTIAFLLPFRVRPMHNPMLMHRIFTVPMTPNLEYWSAFPSDTATYFVALALGLAYLSRRLAIPALLYAGLWVCLPRMYLGLHYLSDIVVGAAIGLAVVWAALRTEWLNSVFAPRVLAFEAKPALFYTCAFLLTFEMADVFDHIRDAVRCVLHAAKIGPYHGLITEGLVIFAGISVIALISYLIVRLRHSHNAMHAGGQA